MADPDFISPQAGLIGTGWRFKSFNRSLFTEPFLALRGRLSRANEKYMIHLLQTVFSSGEPHYRILLQIF
jgi:hypothetical protein